MLSRLKQSLISILLVEDSNTSQERAWNPSSAATALLIETAKADDHFDETELAQIERTLVEVLKIDASQIKQSLQLAEEELGQATCLHEITSIINNDWDIKAKLELIEAMWKVVLSDQHIDPNEQHLMRKVKGLLHIPQSEYIAAKLRARETLESSSADRDI